MSIVSSALVEFANRKKKSWQDELLTAAAAKDWDAVMRLYEKMKSFEFSE
jgi:hypothetical protein